MLFSIKYKAFGLSIILINAFYVAYAGNKEASLQSQDNLQRIVSMNTKNWSFIENKGQVDDNEIKYYGHQGVVYLYCKPGEISFVFTKAEKVNDKNISEASGALVPSACPDLFGGWDTVWKNHELPYPSKTTVNRTDLILLNSNSSAQIIASDQQEYYENYYTTGNADSGITNVHTYKTITYKEIYPYIDMVLHCKQQGMKYEFVVHPGGKVSEIQIQWEGLEGIKKLKDSKIEYSFAFGGMSEEKPVSFQGKNIIKTDFDLNSNQVGFKVKNYDKTKELVIDPYLLWATYFGGSTNEEVGRIAADAIGNIYITGSCASTSQIATNGAFQTSFGGGYRDAFLAKFNTNGQLLWATYYGGAKLDIGSGIAINGGSNICITGATQSLTGIATAGAFQTSANPLVSAKFSYAFIADFNTDGIILWASYYGGNEGGDGHAISSDIYGDIFVAGGTSSSSGLTTSGAYQSSPFGLDCAYLAKFNSNGNRVWATYFSGYPPITDISGIAVDPFGYVLITGSTNSTQGIAINGAYQTQFGGGEDAFLAKFNSDGAMQWSTYFGGSGEEASGNVVTDKYGNVYITGFTSSSSNIATAGAFQTSYSGSDEAFLAKFKTDGRIDWATYFGEYGANGIAMDAFGHVFISGTTAAVSGMATNGAYQSSYGGGGSDAFLAAFDTAGALQWATYYGGRGDDIGEDICADVHGSIYLLGYTSSTNGISTRNSHQSFLGGGNDVFVAKFGYRLRNDAGIDSILSSGGSYCTDTLPVVVKLKNYGTNELDSVQIYLAINGKPGSAYSWTGHLKTDSTTMVNLGKFILKPGVFVIKSWTQNPNGVLDSFPPNDSSVTTINISPLPSANAGPDTILCYNEVYTMKGSGGVTYTWRPAVYLSSATNPNATAILPNTEQYKLVVSNGVGCTDSANVLLKVRPKLTVKAFVDSSIICHGNMVKFSATGYGGDSSHYRFIWVNDSITGESAAIKVYQSGWHKIVLSDNCTPTAGIDSVYITVILPAKSAFTWSPVQNIVEKRPVKFLNQSSDALNFLWRFGNQDSTNDVSPIYKYPDTGSYKIMLIAYGLNNCPADTSFGLINIISDQVKIYVPNAFSPDGNGVNDYFAITGIGIKSYSFNIYNRWGELIYSSPLENLGATGWDGKSNSKDAPEGVYLYTLDVIDVDGIHHYLSGNVTLMR